MEPEYTQSTENVPGASTSTEPTEVERDDQGDSPHILQRKTGLVSAMNGLVLTDCSPTKATSKNGNLGVTVLILGPDRSEMAYKVKLGTKFRHIAKHYEQMKQVGPEIYRYLYDGYRMRLDKTLEENRVDYAELEDGLVVIEAVFFVVGG
ncbi:hypothetical protein AA313_de0207309 [Arthrobotrys entomopaga]|nr:hypothetical protein AA313_de0207309 [Arthrobotrys entomopaga]